MGGAETAGDGVEERIYNSFVRGASQPSLLIEGNALGSSGLSEGGGLVAQATGVHFKDALSPLLRVRAGVPLLVGDRLTRMTVVGPGHGGRFFRLSDPLHQIRAGVGRPKLLGGLGTALLGGCFGADRSLGQLRVACGASALELFEGCYADEILSNMSLLFLRKGGELLQQGDVYMTFLHH